MRSTSANKRAIARLAFLFAVFSSDVVVFAAFVFLLYHWLFDTHFQFICCHCLPVLMPFSPHSASSSISVLLFVAGGVCILVFLCGMCVYVLRSCKHCVDLSVSLVISSYLKKICPSFVVLFLSLSLWLNGVGLLCSIHLLRSQLLCRHSFSCISLICCSWRLHTFDI